MGWNVRARLLVATVCDAAGACLFAPSDIEQVGELPAVLLDRLFVVAKKINALGPEEVAELEKK